jgi:hypothetical protein
MCAVSENVCRAQVDAMFNEEGIMAAAEILCIYGNSIQYCWIFHGLKHKYFNLGRGHLIVFKVQY